MNKTPSQTVTEYINDTKIINTNEKVCLILGVIYSCQDFKELTNIKTIINMSVLQQQHKTGILTTIDSFITNLSG